MDNQVKYLLQESEMPRQWYNIIADLPSPPPPPLHPGTRQPVGPDDLAPLFPAALIAQEVSPERHIEIPEAVLDVYRLWRPTPLFRARRLEKDLGTPARIYYKYEGGSPAGSHKPNTAVPQAYYNASKAAVHHLTKSLAAEWGARGVRVNAVAPTYINMPLTAFAKTNKPMFDAWIDGTPMARMGEPDEIAAVVMFLASDAASLMTGSIVLADGGYTCW